MKFYIFLGLVPNRIVPYVSPILHTVKKVNHKHESKKKKKTES